MKEDDSHRKLLEAFYEYVRLNTRWESRATRNMPMHHLSVNIRSVLSEIRRLSRVRRNEVEIVRQTLTNSTLKKNPFFKKFDEDDDNKPDNL